MIVLDTKVISEAMKSAPNVAVTAWLNEQPSETLYPSSVTLAELLFGVASLPAGKRQERLTETIEQLVQLFRDRILPFDTDAARHYATLAARARSAGQGFPTPAGYIAAIAVSRGCIVATRDTAPFAAAKVAVINPWEM